mmetsp:Transcript_23592/g.26754  ORF Transcript_23592/g.26754 Transcript_23592/m.26754 type:complete len:427 (-) Transcript_23592:363-1643(-)
MGYELEEINKLICEHLRYYGFITTFRVFHSEMDQGVMKKKEQQSKLEKILNPVEVPEIKPKSVLKKRVSPTPDIDNEDSFSHITPGRGSSQTPTSGNISIDSSDPSHRRPHFNAQKRSSSFSSMSPSTTLTRMNNFHQTTDHHQQQKQSPIYSHPKTTQYPTPKKFDTKSAATNSQFSSLATSAQSTAYSSFKPDHRNLSPFRSAAERNITARDGCVQRGDANGATRIRVLRADDVGLGGYYQDCHKRGAVVMGDDGLDREIRGNLVESTSFGAEKLDQLWGRFKNSSSSGVYLNRDELYTFLKREKGITSPKFSELLLAELKEESTGTDFVKTVYILDNLSSTNPFRFTEYIFKIYDRHGSANIPELERFLKGIPTGELSEICRHIRMTLVQYEKANTDVIFERKISFGQFREFAQNSPFFMEAN